VDNHRQPSPQNPAAGMQPGKLEPARHTGRGCKAATLHPRIRNPAHLQKRNEFSMFDFLMLLIAAVVAIAAALATTFTAAVTWPFLSWVYPGKPLLLGKHDTPHPGRVLNPGKEASAFSRSG